MTDMIMPRGDAGQDPPRRAPAPAPAEGPGWARVLGEFYSHYGLALPRLERLAPERLPEPYRRLLAHNNDMTATLERWHGERLNLRVCGREQGPDFYLREVVLELSGSRRPAEYGAIRVHLGRFPSRVRSLILAERDPFGRILQEEGIAHLGWPQAFFALQADARMRRLLDLDEAALVYGRRNVLLDGERRLLAEVIEILPPAKRFENRANPS